MPNYCKNELVLSGHVADVIELLEYIAESVDNYRKRVDSWLKIPANRWSTPPPRSILDFNNILPYPEKFKVLDEEFETLGYEEFRKKYPDGKDGFNNGGYEWRVDKWGTKWNADNSSLYVPGLNTLFFNTAWSPSLPVISALHKRFPKLTFYYEYYENGVGYIGGCVFPSELDFDCNYHTPLEAIELEDRNNHRLEIDSKTNIWEAGRAYNPWSNVYLGHKGG